MKRLNLVILVLFLTGCGAPKISSPPPTPQAITVRFNPPLKPWVDKLSVCASSQSELALYPVEYSNSITNVQAMEIVLEIGSSTEISKTLYASVVGWEQIAIAVNKNNPITRLSTDEIQSIFTGQVPTWGSDSGTPIQVWILPDTDPIRTIFDSVVISNGRITSRAMLAPNAQALLQALATDVNAIGYLPGSYLSYSEATLAEKVHTIQLDPALQDALRQPIIALTKGEPYGVLRNLLICLQGNRN